MIHILRKVVEPSSDGLKGPFSTPNILSETSHRQKHQRSSPTRPRSATKSFYSPCEVADAATLSQCPFFSSLHGYILLSLPAPPVLVISSKAPALFSHVWLLAYSILTGSAIVIHHTLLLPQQLEPPLLVGPGEVLQILSTMVEHVIKYWRTDKVSGG
jgi:hypothetical protein